MKYPVVKLVFDRRKVASKKKKGTIEVEVYWQGKRQYRSTGIAVYKGEWNDRSMVIARHDMEDLNKMLNKMVGDLRNAFLKEHEEEREITHETIKAFLDRKHNELPSFVEFWEKSITCRPIKEKTRKQHTCVLSVFKSWGGITTFADISTENIYKWDSYMKERQMKQSSIRSYHGVVKCYIGEARKAGLFKDDPYNGMKISKGKRSDVQWLTEDEVKRLMEWEPIDERTANCRDLFIVQCYTGLAYVDLSMLKWENVIRRDGRYMIADSRHKTDEAYFIVLLPPVIEVFKRHNYELPKISLAYYDTILKVIAGYVGIKINLRSHIGRHTFAVMMINAGVSIDVLAKAMGHSSSRTTEIYATVLGKTVRSAFDTLAKAMGCDKDSEQS